MSSEPTCSCWCSTTEGAISTGTKSVLQCKDACKQKKGTFLTCASSPSAWPINDLRCFTNSQCTDDLSKNGYNGVWDTRSNADCPADYRYCFSKPDNGSIELSVPIGNMKTVEDLETYLSVGFSWLTGTAVTISILFVMIGGLQYTMGGISQEQVKKGKKRIQDGVTGLVLLLCSVLLLQTVSPQLLKLNLPKLPMIKRVITAEGTSCEDYLLKKYVLTQTEGKCGNVSDVVKDENGNAVAEGTQCVWKTCENRMDRCLLFSGGAKCTSCEDVIEGPNGVGIEPSPSVCDQFRYAPEKNDGQPFFRFCGWTKDSDLNAGILPKALRHGSCAYFSIDCRNIDSCSDYDKQVTPTNRNKTQPLEDIIFEDEIMCGINGCGNFGLQTICLWNPCSEKNGGKIKGDCKYDGRWDCQNP